MKTRLQWVDNTKALGMLLVFWGHLLEKGFFGHPLIHEVYKAIYSFHMPLFFLLAGFFLSANQEQRFGQVLVQKIKSRLVPVMFFVALAIPLWMWPKPEAWGMPTDPNVLQNAWLLLQGKPTINWTGWFLVCLFVVELTASELIFALSRRWIFLLSLPCLYFAGYELTTNLTPVANAIGITPNWWFLQEGVMCLFFYLCGYGLFHYLPMMLPSESRGKSVMLMMIALSCLLLTFNRNFSDGLGTVNLSGGDHGDWLWFLISSLAGILSLIHLGKLVSANSLLSSIGKNTLPLLGINGLFLHFFNIPFWNFVVAMTSSDTSLLMATFIVAVTTLLLSLPVAMALNRWAPFLVGRWK